MHILSKDEPCTYNDIVSLASTYITNKDDLKVIDDAYNFVMLKHEGQQRKSGEPYTIHLIWVAYILCTLQTGPQTIAAGLLHDVMEDCDVSREEMVERFGEDITTLVEGVTKINKLPHMEEIDFNAENHRKIYIAMAKDIRVILIKLADRLHNMRTLEFMPDYKQQRISRETLEVYAPIAHRLGINDIRVELEDLALSYLDPNAYEEIVFLLEKKDNERKVSVEKMIASVENILSKNHIEYRIKGRAKHIYSIYKKMIKKNLKFDELYDLNALRIILKDKLTCYEVLGLIHDAYRPVPGRFKDYIAMPKPNMYQSLHTVVVGEDGNLFEIQIRSEEMDELAERGIASHWRYKEDKPYSKEQEQKDIVDKLSWLSEFVTLSDEIQDKDAKEYYESLRKDIFEANVYVMSPQGKIIELPNGATPIDFAYRIHSEVGHHCVGAIVNNSIVPLDTPLKTGDVCEIKTNKSSHPKEDWLKIVHTAGARNKIKQYLSKLDTELKEEKIEEGRKLLKDEIHKRGLDEKKYLDPKTYNDYYGSFGVKDFEELLFLLGKKQGTSATILDKVAPNKSGFFDNLGKMLKKNNTMQQSFNSSDNGISVAGVGGLKTQLSKCCNPIPGDKIVGYVSKGQGIKVHRADCPNVKLIDKGRLIEVYWDYASIINEKYEVELQLEGLDRPNLLSDVVTSLTTHQVSILAIHADTDDLNTHITIKISVDSASTLQNTIDNLNRVQGIYTITRIIH